MSNRPKNEPIGEVACPILNCRETAKLYRYRARSGDRVPRFAGKFYSECPVHGRYGAVPTAASQAYFEEKGTFFSPAPASSAAGPSPSPAASRPAPAPAGKQTPKQTAPAKQTNKTPAQPAKEVPWWKRPLDGL